MLSDAMMKEQWNIQEDSDCDHVLHDIYHSSRESKSYTYISVCNFIKKSTSPVNSTASCPKIRDVIGIYGCCYICAEEKIFHRHEQFLLRRSITSKHQRMLQTNSLSTLVVLFIVLIVNACLLLIYYVVKRCCPKLYPDSPENRGEEGERQDNTNSSEDDNFGDNPPIVETSLIDGNSTQTNNRRALVLDNIIHRTVVKHSEANNDLILPHEKTMIRRESSRSLLNVSNVNKVAIDKVIDKQDLSVHSKAFNEFRGANNNTNQDSGGYSFGFIDFSWKSGNLFNEMMKNKEKSNLVLEPGSSVMQSEDSSSSLYSPRACPICLETYKAGEDVAWSHNEECFHAFHLECIVDWLMKSDECPMCRENYLNMGAETAQEEA